MKTTNVVPLFLSLLMAVLLAFGCQKSTEKQMLSDAFARYLTNSESTIFYGKVDFLQLMEKSDLKSSPLFGAVVSEELTEIEKAVDIKQQLFFAVDGPLTKNLTPSRFAVFLAVNDIESIEKYLKKAGYLVKESKSGLKFVEEMGIAIGFNQDVLIAFNDSQVDELIPELEKTFTLVMSEKSPINDGYDLNGKEDLFIASNLEYFYGTSNTDLNKLPEAQQENIRQLTAGSFYRMSLTFDDGEIIFANNYHFNDELKNRMFFSDVVDSEWITRQNVNVSDSEPWMIGNLQLDMRKLESIMQDFNINAFDDLLKEFGTAGMFIKSFAKNGLSDLMNGQIGISAYNLGSAIDMGGIKDYDVFIGAGAVFDDVKELLDVLADDGFLNQKNGAFSIDDQTNVQLEKGQIRLERRSGAEWAEHNVPIRTNLVELGIHPIELLIDVQSAAAGMSEKGEITSVFTDALDYIYVEGGNNHLTIKIALLEKEMNSLRFLFKRAQQQMEQLSIAF
jgi:hypothetical protein